MSTNQDNAAHSLVGKELKNGWTVLKKIEPKEGSTGGFFSVCYVVTRGEEEAFLKALNFQAFFQMFRGRPIVEIINEQTNAYQFERDLLLRCKNNKLSKVSMIVDEGEEVLEGFTIPNVPYLVFEMSDGDVRSHMNFSKDVEIAWKLQSLHNVAVGLKQLHSIEIGHQDLKPSNVLLYQDGIVSKVGDLGRSLCAEIEAPHENGGDFPGDLNYAPTEFLYRYIDPDWNFRVRSTDMYLFGSLIVFYFSGANMTALIGKNLDPQFKWTHWRGKFEGVHDYLVDAFYKAIKEFKSSISDKELGDELSKIIEYCCFPIPERRGHPKAITLSLNRDGSRNLNSNQFDFHRIVSKFDILYRMANYKFK
ncbi:protein kinase [Algoriphagus sp.]|uniref:protein kinase domain-containing protein n=1 Tax=Algoriphagus sp. TaxID=1872435 RepID=UPI0026140366|nr:protein kinase [Algoriphagus sp.]